ncbi:hypothetical protein [Mesorhizobium sp.]|uniref:hypothetical protein n=1 Tax=Mesorhizobium sp. TaxID=1871066 RepID=UPI0025797A6F|nr:hypothetical protein [Mesorhizobium sp.]
MYLFILSALAAIILSSIGLVMLAMGRRGEADRRILHSSYWFAAAAAIVLVGAITFFTI